MPSSGYVNKGHKKLESKSTAFSKLEPSHYYERYNMQGFDPSSESGSEQNIEEITRTSKIGFDFSGINLQPESKNHNPLSQYENEAQVLADKVIRVPDGKSTTLTSFEDLSESSGSQIANRQEPANVAN